MTISVEILIINNGGCRVVKTIKQWVDVSLFSLLEMMSLISSVRDGEGVGSKPASGKSISILILFQSAPKSMAGSIQR